MSGKVMLGAWGAWRDCGREVELGGELWRVA